MGNNCVVLWVAHKNDTMSDTTTCEKINTECKNALADSPSAMQVIASPQKGGAASTS